MLSTYKNSLLALVAVFIWASNFIVQKFGMVSLRPEEFTLVRFALALPFIFFVGKPKDNIVILAIIGLFWNVINYNCLTTAIKFSQNVGICSFVFQTCVIYGTLFNWILNGQKITVTNAFGMFLSLLGVFILKGNVGGTGGELLYTFVLPSVAAVSWGFGFSLIKKYQLGSNLNTMVWLTAVSFAFQALVHLVQSRADFGFVHHITWQSLACIGYAFLFSTVLAGIIWMYLCKRMSGHSLSIYFLMVPLFTTILSVLLLDEKLTVATFIGGTLIITGLLLNQEKKLNIGKFLNVVVGKNSLFYRSR